MTEYWGSEKDLTQAQCLKQGQAVDLFYKGDVDKSGAK